MNTFKKIMRGIGRFLGKIKWLIILLVLGFIGLTAYKYNANKAAIVASMSNNSTQETATIEERNVLNTITATGKIESAKTRTVASTIVKDTRITAVNCEVGDTVNEGDILVTFSDEKINKTISQLQADIAESKATKAVNDTANTRTYYYSYGTETLTMRDLQQTIDEKQKDLNEACNAYGEAKSKLENLKNSYNGMDDQIPKTDELGQQVTMPDENGNMQTVYVNNSEKSSLKSQIEAQENTVANALKSQENAQLAYDKAVQALNDEIYKGSNSLAQATESYEKSTITSNDSTKSLQRQLEQYQDSLDDYVITAPISGTVTKVNVEENNSFAGGDMVTIQDVSTLYVSTEIDEYDIPDIVIGQRVVIKTDATRDDELEGVVDSIENTATAAASGSSSSSATYAVKIKINDTDERLKLGMTAKLSIILEEKDNVLAVPYNAIVEKDDGSKVVCVSTASQARPDKAADGEIGNISKASAGEDGFPGGDMPSGEKPDFSGGMPGAPGSGFSLSQILKIAYGNNEDQLAQNRDTTKEYPVTVGLESDYYSEISGDGIKSGMTVVIPSAESENIDPMMMMMGGGGAPGGGGGRP